jgi:DNA-directed RNA polymerase specialized sigma24 family protein
VIAPPGVITEGETVRDLVERAQEGDRDAFAALVGLTSDRMYGLATRILRDSVLAEDALQGALITVWRQLPALRDPDRFEAWVRRLLVHQCYAEARRRRSGRRNQDQPGRRQRHTGRYLASDKEEPRVVGPGVQGKGVLVAGTGFEPVTFGL